MECNIPRRSIFYVYRLISVRSFSNIYIRVNVYVCIIIYMYILCIPMYILIYTTHSSVSGYNFVAEGVALESMFVHLPCYSICLCFEIVWNFILVSELV